MIYISSIDDKCSTLMQFQETLQAIYLDNSKFHITHFLSLPGHKLIWFYTILKDKVSY